MHERERIARELHDTLLQGFHGLMLRIQAVADRMKSEPDEAHRALKQALLLADAVMAEGRDRVRDLRTIRADSFDLLEVFRRVVEDARCRATIVRMTIEGVPRELQRIPRQEVENIGTEAIKNSLRHAKASQVAVEIMFERRQFAVRVSDNGIGIATAITRTGREGHFGLIGMRERAFQIGGDLSIATRPGGGTEIELIVPAAAAYTPQEASNPVRRVAAIVRSEFGNIRTQLFVHRRNGLGE